MRRSRPWTTATRAASARGAFNAPIGDMAAVRVDLYWHHLPGFIDAIQPGGGLKKDVNDGDRTGARVAFLIKPNDALSITPRIVYQNLTTNGFPRVDLYNILANPYTAVKPGDDRQPAAVHPAARGTARPVHARSTSRSTTTLVPRR